MFRWMAQGLACLIACLIACVGTTAQALPITLDFEGIAPHERFYNLRSIGDYYHGRAVYANWVGPDLGVSLSNSAHLLCLNTLNVDCSGTSKAGLGPTSSQLGALYFSQTAPVISVEDGFDQQLSLWYTNPFGDSVGIEIHASSNGTGTPLARAWLPGTGTGSPACADYGSGDLAARYCPFVPFSIDFAGQAHSIKFIGTVNRSVYDDISFGALAASAGVAALPEPGTALVSLLALAGLAATRRRQPLNRPAQPAAPVRAGRCSRR